MDVVIEALSNHPQFVAAAAEWHWKEWGHTDPAGSLESWTTGLASQAGADDMPGTLLALSDGAPAGVICLVVHDMPGYEPAAGLSPWIKGLYVAPSARRQGLGVLLVRRCEEWAASLGHDALYLYTERGSGAETLYAGLAWEPIGVDDYEGIDVAIMRRSLTPGRTSGAPNPAPGMS